MKIEFRDLTADEIEIRVGRAIKSDKFEGCTLLLYKNARVDMDILDETVGSMNWKRDHVEIKGNLYCNISIYDSDKKEWVTKQDCGVESNTEKEKGEASDASKRSCVNWGIGRALYTAPKITVQCSLDRDGKKPASGIGWYVKEIGYTANHKINRLVIMETKYDKDTQVVFDWSLEKVQSPTNHKTIHTINDSDKSSNQSRETTTPVRTQNMSLEEAKKVCFASGKSANIPFERLRDDQLQWVSENSKGKYVEAADIILRNRKFLKELDDDNTPTPFDEE